MQPSYKKQGSKKKKLNIRWRYLLFTYTKHQVSEFITCDHQRCEFVAISLPVRTQAYRKSTQECFSQNRN